MESLSLLVEYGLRGNLEIAPLAAHHTDGLAVVIRPFTQNRARWINREREGGGKWDVLARG